MSTFIRVDKVDMSGRGFLRFVSLFIFRRGGAGVFLENLVKTGHGLETHVKGNG